MEKFTVIIPTLNRAEILRPTLDSCVAIQDENFQILISDNLSEDHTLDVVAEYRQRDPRIRLIQPKTRLGQSGHWDFILEHVTEGFIMLLGSDDALLPGSVARARKCLGDHPESRIFYGPPCVTYFYPELYTEDSAGRLYVRFAKGQEIRNSREWLTKVAQSQCDATVLPLPYQLAWVHVSLLREIVAKVGRYILSPVPDVSLGVALAALEKEFVCVSPGFSVGGVSSTSIGTGVVHPKGDRSVEKVFLGGSEIPFHAKVPYVRSGHVWSGDVFLQAKEVGLLPPDFPIAWDRMVARAFLQFELEPWSAEDKDVSRQRLRELAQNVNCVEIVDSLDASESIEAWAAALPFVKDWMEVPWDIVLDVRPLGIKNVHQAAQLAELLMLSAGDCRESTPQFEKATPEQLLMWAVLQLSEQQRKTQGELQSTVQQSARRARERDQTKSKNKLLLEKVKNLREKNANTRRPGLRQKISRWLRRSS
jgi:hypothetical protein